MQSQRIFTLMMGLALMIGTAHSAHAEDAPQPYPAIGGEKAEEAKHFRVTVGDAEVPTVAIGGRHGHMARFAMSGPQTVTIRVADSKPKSVTLRPRRAGIEPKLEDGVLTFVMDKPENLYIKLDDQPDLHLLAYPPIEAPAARMSTTRSRTITSTPRERPRRWRRSRKPSPTSRKKAAGRWSFPTGPTTAASKPRSNNGCCLRGATPRYS